MTQRPALLALADRAGIHRDYTDNRNERRPASDATREALLSAMGFDASTEAGALRGLAELGRRADRLLDPASVTPDHAPALRLRLPRGATGDAHWTIECVHENGLRQAYEGRTPVTRSRKWLELPLADLAGTVPGYSEVHARLRVGDHDRSARQQLIRAPAACLPLASRVPGRRFGINANLYAARGVDDWGCGDFAQLASLIDYAAAARAVFVGINPLHTLRNRNGWVSPYSPISRLFRNCLYIDIGRVPELEHCAEARSLAASPGFAAERERLRRADLVDYPAVLALKRAVLRLLHETFLRRRADGADTRDFDRYRARHGDALVDFATYCAIEEQLTARDGKLDDWRRWPPALRDPRSDAVRAFRDSNARDVDLHVWMQYETDRQLGSLATHASRAGLRLGLFGDLAIGSAPGAADHWAFPGLFVDGASLGAPPDDYSGTGQNWGLPPMHPAALEESGYCYWRMLLRNALEHVGALRIDHVMGLFRQYWIPEGRSGGEGAYVRFPWESLLAVLAIESRRANAVIVGEDLGTVPRGLSARLARMEILSTRVLYFERERSGAFRPSRRYSRRALVTANTHDAPPLAGFWSGRDLELRRSIGALDADAFARAAAERDRARNALLARLATERILPPGAWPGSAELCTAVHRFLAHTPSPLLGIALDDLAGETVPVNVPGVDWRGYPSWMRRSRVTVESLRTDPDAMRALSGVRERTRAR